MEKGLVPELHDIFKLTTYGHVYDNFPYLDYIPNTETWQGIIGHHCKGKIESESLSQFISFPNSPETFFLSLADSLASNFSRPTLETRGKGEYFVQKLWKKSQSQNKCSLLQEKDEIVALLKFLGKNPSWRDFMSSSYKNLLFQRPEDAHPGKNITSLYTHSKLTGQFYRILSSSFKIEEKEFVGKNRDQIFKLNEQKRESWKLMVYRIKFHFFQKPFRAKDLNIFLNLKKFRDEIKRNFSDNILLMTSDEVLLVLPGEEFFSQIKEIATKYRFWLEIERVSGTLGGIKPEPLGMGQARKEENIYDELPEKIIPPLCEICQMARATKEWFSVEDNLADREESTSNITEHLCDTCYSIRSQQSPLKKLARWTEEGQTKVAWVNLKLNLVDLTTKLKELYSNYLKEIKNPFSQEPEIRFSVISEFQQDYNLFIKEFQKEILKSFGLESVEEILPDFLCIRIEKKNEIISLLKIYKESLQKFFPKFIDGKGSPLKFSIAYTSSKFPFFECYRIIENPISDIQITLIGQGTIKIDNAHLENLLLASNFSYNRSALYKLAEISKIYESLARLKFYDRSERKDFETYSQLQRNLLPLGMDFRSILTFAKLLVT